MKRRLLLQAVPVSMATPAVWAAERFPSKPITWICPYGAGGNADTRSRLVAKGMSAILGQPIIVDNKAGAGGNIGTEFIARAKPDGYTIGMGNFAPLSVNHALFKKLNFDPLADIVPPLP
jgi:tripartite-type tricarboxylate transporter receptor subunit TctC